jgi:hypothetical protein
MMRFLDIMEDTAEIFALQKRNPSMLNRLRRLNYRQSNLFSNLGDLAHIVGGEEEEAVQNRPGNIPASFWSIHWTARDLRFLGNFR